MATAVVRYTAAAVSDRGRKRPSNEDAYGFSVEAGVYLVCDGMGGAAAGEIASTIAVDEVLRLLTDRNPENSVALPDAAQSAICAANEAIFSRAQRNHRLSGMGTTLVALAARGAQLGAEHRRQPLLPASQRQAGATHAATTRWWKSRCGSAE